MFNKKCFIKSCLRNISASEYLNFKLIVHTPIMGIIRAGGEGHKGLYIIFNQVFSQFRDPMQAFIWKITLILNAWTFEECLEINQTLSIYKSSCTFLSVNLIHFLKFWKSKVFLNHTLGMNENIIF